MKKTIKTMTVLMTGVVLTLGLSVSSCKKAEKGDMGPQGTAGINGTNGTNGNANVKTMTVTVTAVDWTASGSGGMQSTVITNTNITQDIIDKGAIMVYMVNAGQTSALPLMMYPSSSYGINMQFTASLNSLAITVQRTDLVAAVNPGTLTYKIVTIAASAKMQNPNVNYSDYKAVQRAFNLKD